MDLNLEEIKIEHSKRLRHRFKGIVLCLLSFLFFLHCLTYFELRRTTVHELFLIVSIILLYIYTKNFSYNCPACNKSDFMMTDSFTNCPSCSVSLKD